MADKEIDIDQALASFDKWANANKIAPDAINGYKTHIAEAKAKPGTVIKAFDQFVIANFQTGNPIIEDVKGKYEKAPPEVKDIAGRTIENGRAILKVEQETTKKKDFWGGILDWASKNKGLLFGLLGGLLLPMLGIGGGILSFIIPLITAAIGAFMDGPDGMLGLGGGGTGGGGSKNQLMITPEGKIQVLKGDKPIGIVDGKVAYGTATDIRLSELGANGKPTGRGFIGHVTADKKFEVKGIPSLLSNGQPGPVMEFIHPITLDIDKQGFIDLKSPVLTNKLNEAKAKYEKLESLPLINGKDGKETSVELGDYTANNKKYKVVLQGAIENNKAVFTKAILMDGKNPVVGADGKPIELVFPPDQKPIFDVKKGNTIDIMAGAITQGTKGIGSKILADQKTAEEAAEKKLSTLLTVPAKTVLELKPIQSAYQSHDVQMIMGDKTYKVHLQGHRKGNNFRVRQVSLFEQGQERVITLPLDGILLTGNAKGEVAFYSSANYTGGEKNRDALNKAVSEGYRNIVLTDADHRKAEEVTLVSAGYNADPKNQIVTVNLDDKKTTPPTYESSFIRIDITRGNTAIGNDTKLPGPDSLHQHGYVRLRGTVEKGVFKATHLVMQRPDKTDNGNLKDEVVKLAEEPINIKLTNNTFDLQKITDNDRELITGIIKSRINTLGKGEKPLTVAFDSKAPDGEIVRPLILQSDPALMRPARGNTPAT